VRVGAELRETFAVRTTLLVALSTLLTGPSYAADKITLTCSGMQWDGRLPIKKETVPPQSVIIDLVKGIVMMPLGDSDLSEITEDYVMFAGVSDDRKRSWKGRIDRISGSGYVTTSFGSEFSSNTLSCKPAKPLF
jgi:hypothetical protein